MLTLAGVFRRKIYIFYHTKCVECVKKTIIMMSFSQGLCLNVVCIPFSPLRTINLVGRRHSKWKTLSSNTGVNSEKKAFPAKALNGARSCPARDTRSGDHAAAFTSSKSPQRPEDGRVQTHEGAEETKRLTEAVTIATCARFFGSRQIWLSSIMWDNSTKLIVD